MRSLAFVLFLCACGGSRDVIQSSPNHPANPDAPVAKVEAAPEPERSAEPAEPEPATESPPEPEPVDPNVAIAEAEQTAYAAAKPVFDKWCAKCHGPKGKKGAKKHFDMSSYPFGGHHAADLGEEIRETLGVEGDKPTMPADKPGAVQGEELELIVTWSKAYEAAHKAGLHKGHKDHHH